MGKFYITKIREGITFKVPNNTPETAVEFQIEIDNEEVHFLKSLLIIKLLDDFRGISDRMSMKEVR